MNRIKIRRNEPTPCITNLKYRPVAVMMMYHASLVIIENQSQIFSTLPVLNDYILSATVLL